VRYMREASSINFRRSVEYGTRTLGTLVAYSLHRWRIRRSSIFEKKQTPSVEAAHEI